MTDACTTTQTSPPHHPRPILLIVNPISGSRSAPSFTESRVVPLIRSTLPGTPLVLKSTQHANHAGTLIKEFIAAQLPLQGTSTDFEILADEEKRRGGTLVDIVLASGDGTLHEIINALPPSNDPEERPVQVNVALVPCGTANALYHSLFPDNRDHAGTTWMLQSVQVLMHPGKERPSLRIARISFVRGTKDPSKQEPVIPSISSCVVVSTCLHATILHCSEALRATIPGIERFKVAARENITRWYNATAKLKGNVQKYDSRTKTFVRYNETVELDGPFAYFLSTTAVDRLEAEFAITRLLSRIPPPEGTNDFMDIVVIRPFRDPDITDDSGESRIKFAPRLGEILQEAYKDGAHVEMRYSSGEGNNSGEEVVEYFRCSGWEWLPVSL